MARTADETKTAILGAATQEFSTYGIAGARTERIASASGANVSLLFRYFGSKAGLFDAAFGSLATDTVDDVPFDAEDLPGYAGRLVDYYQAHPALVRMSAWYQLERRDDELPVEVRDSYAAKLTALSQAQRAGRVSATLPAEQLLNLVIHLSIAGTGVTPVLTPEPLDSAQSRAAVIAAVQAITAA
jgi:AcrR family transcriptional regulator